MIKIRGIEYEVNDLIDRDIMAIAALVSQESTVPLRLRDQEAAEVLRSLFPDLPEQLTRGDRVRLNMPEIGDLVEQLAILLMSDEEYRKSVQGNPSMQNMLSLWEAYEASQQALDQVSRPAIAHAESRDERLQAEVRERILRNGKRVR